MIFEMILYGIEFAYIKVRRTTIKQRISHGFAIKITSFSAASRKSDHSRTEKKRHQRRRVKKTYVGSSIHIHTDQSAGVR